MAISKLLPATLLLISSAAYAREAATPAACQAAGSQPPISDARAAVGRDAKDQRAQFRLADAWSEAGCFNDALRVLIAAEKVSPGNPEIETRLRVARSVVGEEHFFDNLDRAEDEARLKRATFRCTSLFDTDACADALQSRPDDAALVEAQGDAFMHAKRAQEALSAYEHALALKPEQAALSGKITAAQSQIPAAPASDHARPPVQLARVPTPHRITAARPIPAATAPMSADHSNVESEAHSH